MTVDVLCLFLKVPWVGLWYVLVVFPDYTHLLFLITVGGLNFGWQLLIIKPNTPHIDHIYGTLCKSHFKRDFIVVI